MFGSCDLDNSGPNPSSAEINLENSSATKASTTNFITTKRLLSQNKLSVKSRLNKSVAKSR